MTESNTQSGNKAPASPRRSRKVRTIVLATVVALAAGAGVAAWADGRGGGCGGHGMSGPGMGGPGMMLGSGRMSDRMLDGLDATEAQRTQIRQITQAAAARMKTEFEAGRALREQGLAIFSAPTIDPAAVESLRQQMLAQHDQMSRQMTETMLAVANVLTPEQRAKFAERIKTRGEERRDRMQQRRGASSPTN